MSNQELLTYALAAREHAYAPYSHFRVGAALLCADGTVYIGCNVEGASYGNAICAERTALCKAISEGARDFVLLAVVGDSEEICTPCGICRQMLWEFAPELRILCADRTGTRYEDIMLRELLPHAFSKSDL